MLSTAIILQTASSGTYYYCMLFCSNIHMSACLYYSYSHFKSLGAGRSRCSSCCSYTYFTGTTTDDTGCGGGRVSLHILEERFERINAVDQFSQFLLSCRICKTMHCSIFKVNVCLCMSTLSDDVFHFYSYKTGNAYLLKSLISTSIKTSIIDS